MNLNDRVSLAGSARRTSDGYLAATARVARSGIQIYAGSEVGKPEMATVRVWRPPAEVFSDATMKSFAHRPMTLEHPDRQVNASNWRDFSVGQTGGKVHRDGDFIVVDLVMMDESAIKSYESGKRELSCGYDCDLEFTKGTTPEGEAYDAIQRGIRNNHVALVGAARGGPELRISESDSDARAQARRDHEEWKRSQAASDSGAPVLDAYHASAVAQNLRAGQAAIDAAKNAGQALKDAVDHAMRQHAEREADLQRNGYHLSLQQFDRSPQG